MGVSENWVLPAPPQPPEAVVRERDRLLSEATTAEDTAQILREQKIHDRTSGRLDEAAALLDGYARGLRSVAAVVYRMWYPRSGGIA